MSNRIVIIGAGSTNFGLGIVGDFFKSKILSGSNLTVLSSQSPLRLRGTATATVWSTLLVERPVHR